MLEQCAPYQGPDGGSGGGNSAPDTQRYCLIALIFKGLSNNREDAGHDHGAAEGHERPCPDQRSDIGRKGGQYRTCAEDTQPGQQHSAMADPVRKRAHGNQQAGHQQRVDVDDPQNLGARCLQRKGQ